MNNLIRKKAILCLLDSDSKSADAIVNELSQSLTTVDNQLTELVSDSICDKMKQGDGCEYTIRKDIATFAELVKVFLSNPEEHNQETQQFISSEYYLTRIDHELVDYVLSRFHLGSIYRTNEMKEDLRRILLASPSALSFALDGDTELFDRVWSNRNQLDSSDTTHDRSNGILYLVFQKRLLEKLIADMENPTYGILLAKLQLHVAKISIKVGMATPNKKYVEAIAEGDFTVNRAMENLPAGQPAFAVNVNPIMLSNYGSAFLNLRDLQTALEYFDEALNIVTDPIQKAFVLNNKGVAFLRFGQYQKAIACFEEGIALDSGTEIPELRENKETVKEYLARATDTDNLTEPTKIPFIRETPIPFEETLFYEFKEIKGRTPAKRIEKTVEEYVVAFLNRQGGRIFWGIRDKTRITIGVELDEQVRDDIRSKVSDKLGRIQPPISPEHCQLAFHNVYDLQEETIEDLWVVELLIPPAQERNVFFTENGKLFVKTDGGRKELKGSSITEFIVRRMQNNTETDEIN